VQSIRTGGGWDVTLTLPDGRRTTFAFTPTFSPSASQAFAHWAAPPDVHATLEALGSEENIINLVPGDLPVWQTGGGNFTFQNHDIGGWVLTNSDGTQYFITRGTPNHVDYFPEGVFIPIDICAYGPPALTQIIQRTGDIIKIDPSVIKHYPANSSSTPTRSVWFDRDGQNRIIAIHDQISGSNGVPVVQYLYDQNSGNLVQVLKLTDRVANTYTTNRYLYSNLQFPHYITEIDNSDGVPVARNYYDSSGRLIATVDANSNTNQFIHSLSNSLEIVIDRLGHTNIFAYDSRGNVTATTNALNGVTLSAFDAANNKTNEVAFLNGVPYATNRWTYTPQGFLWTQTDPLGHTATFLCNSYGQVTNSIDARGFGTTNNIDPATGNLLSTSDSLSNITSYFYDPSGPLAGTRDPLGTVTTNYFDSSGNVIASATLDSSSVILSTNTALFDANGNQTNSVVWRRLGSGWTGATNTFVFDAQNRRIATTAPDGGVSRVAFNELGRAVQTIDALTRTNLHAFDLLGREYKTTYPDGYSEFTLFDAVGNAYAHVDRAGRTNYTIFDACNRNVGTLFADGTTNWTVLDDLGRLRLSVDGRGITNAPGYNCAGQRTSLTNALGTAQQAVYRYGFDENGNETWSLQPDGTGTTNVFDPLNRPVETDYADGTKTFTGYNAAGQRVAVTNQDWIITLFGNDGMGRLTSVTNAFGTTNQAVTRYGYDEAGNETQQIDALNRTNLFQADGIGRRIKHTLPGGQAESWGFDLVGNEIRHTNFNAVVITNQFDSMNRLTNLSSANGYQTAFTYTPTGQRWTMTNASGLTSYYCDCRDRLTNKVVAWSGGPIMALNYAYDRNGDVTNIWSSTSGGVNLQYSFDALNRITNVLANGSQVASYGFTTNGSVQTIRYGNGLTNLCQYDLLTRLTNSVWKSNQLVLASFFYQLGSTGNRTNLTETLLTSVTNRTYGWGFDPLYRLRSESISGIGSTSYGLDLVGNRTNRTAGLDSLPAQNFSYTTNDWLATDAYDSDGNTLWTTNGGAATGPYYYNVEDRLTNFNNGAVMLWYDGDGNRVKKTAGSTNFFYLVDDRNPSGYAQVLEEWTASGGTTNLSRVCNWGLALISQRESSGPVYYFIPDGHGSTRLLTDTNVAVVNTFSFDAYGNLIASNGPPQTAQLYCGEYFDPHLGLLYLRGRLDNLQTGRFLTKDSFDGGQEDPLTLHKYLYAGDDPVNKVDPSGEEYEAVGMLAVADIFSGFFAQISPATSRAAATARRVLGTGRVSSKAFWEVYPDYNTFIAAMVWDLVGGSVGATYGPNPATDQMSCATRVSYALNNVGGNDIPKLGDPASPNTPPRSQRNRKSVSWHGREGDNKYYIVSAGDMKAYLLQKWGKEDAKIRDVPTLKQFTAGLGAGQIAVFATPGLSGNGHSGVLKQSYHDPYVELELNAGASVWVWALSTP
jgi:RHS repeat-associated protein